MSLIPLLPLFHEFNRTYFAGELVKHNKPLVTVKWSDNRMSVSAGFYKRHSTLFQTKSFIILSKPILSNLSITAIKSTLCHEMIHAWLDLVKNIKEAHGSNFVAKMNAINSAQNHFHITIKHNYPVTSARNVKIGFCQSCKKQFLYKKRMKGLACKECCENFYNGKWNENCLILFS
tara:strand:- start:671 stop:1198 length:528 start_codon:yes stop_codon:yes gene_type:complete